MDFDQERIYYSHQNLQRKRDDADENDDSSRATGDAPNNTPATTVVPDDENGDIDMDKVRRHLREFLRNYRQGPHLFLYRERLLRMHRRTSGDSSANPSEQPALDLLPDGIYPTLEVDLAHIGEYDSTLLSLLLTRPLQTLPIFENAALDALSTLLFSQSTTPTPVSSPVQILLRGSLSPTSLRSITASHMNKLLVLPGIVISTSRIRSRASKIRIRCSRCLDSQTILPSGPFSGCNIPMRCASGQSAECGPAPYAVIPDESEFVDEQSLKLQEMPECVPTGEMPRSVLLSCERGLVDRCPPGTRVGVYGIPQLFTSAGKKGTKSLYLRVVGISKARGRDYEEGFTPAMEEAFHLLSKRRDIYDVLWRSIAPSISGGYTVDIKKAITCMLMGGCRKKLPDGLRLRGDINVLLLGDPSTAKSQFLKYTHRVSPIGVYTSGKGSSAAGLTASVVRDPRGEFYLEGGAMVLADGGVVCIDEFDKMRPADRVAIHEAMEQQTISVAKAGITTVLNSRASVLAAANPVFGRYDDLKSAEENIDLMTTILSRFDLIFLVRDVRDEERDRSICRHVMGVHMSHAASHLGKSYGEDAGNAGEEGDDASPESIATNASRIANEGGVLDCHTIKKYIQYCKSRCIPRLTEEAGDVLASAYVNIRNDVRQRNELKDPNESQSVIPITVRQLEALVRLSESLAKMRLDTEVHAQDVAEAMRLFRVSTMVANAAGQNLSADGSQDISRVEQFLCGRLGVGQTFNRQKIVEEASGRGFDAMTVAKVMAIMVMRGELQERNSGRMVKRIK